MLIEKLDQLSHNYMHLRERNRGKERKRQRENKIYTHNIVDRQMNWTFTSSAHRNDKKSLRQFGQWKYVKYRIRKLFRLTLGIEWMKWSGKFKCIANFFSTDSIAVVHGFDDVFGLLSINDVNLALKPFLCVIWISNNHVPKPLVWIFEYSIPTIHSN